MQKIEVGKKYRHYKGNIYKIAATAKHSETTEDMIVYQSMKDGEYWVRPYKMWNEVIDEKGTLRFTIIKEEEEKHHHQHDEDCDCGCHEHEHEEEWKEIEHNYTSKITVDDWEELLSNKNIFDKEALIVLKRFRHAASPLSYAELADMFGYGALYYEGIINKTAEKLVKHLQNKDIAKEEYWAILLNGWAGEYGNVYTLRDELYEAIGNIDLSNIPLR